MASLSDEHKQFIVERLAQFDSPTDVQKALKVHFSVDATLQQLSAYDPTTVAGKRLSEKLKQLFEQVRKAFIEDRSTIAITHASYRQRLRLQLLQLEKVKANPVMVLRILEAAQKDECGNYGQGPTGGNQGGGDDDGDVDIDATERVAVLADLLDTLRTRKNRDIVARRTAGPDTAQGGAGTD